MSYFLLNNEKYNNNCKTNKEIVIKKDQAKQTIIYSKQLSIVKIKCEIERYKMTTKICLFKKLLFTMENATAADSSQSNISRIYI